MATESKIPHSSDDRFESWKAIANYLRRDVRTVQRWEQDEGLPVHRHEHLKQATVYAYKAEIDAWRAKRDRPRTQSLKNRWMYAVILAVISVGVAAAVLLLREDFPGASPGDDRSLLVVLPFEDLSQDPLHPMADALTEELGSRLASAAPGKLSVVARTSAMSFKERRPSVREIREQLNVDFLLEGSIRSSGESVRVTVQLVDATTEAREWAGNFDYAIGSWLELQEQASRDILAKVGESLQLELATAQRAQLSTQEAFEKVLLGWHYFDQFQAATLGDAIALFTEASRLDPQNIDAYIGNSLSYAARAFFRMGSDSQSYAEAERWADAALQLDAENGTALAVLGWVDFANRWDWRTAEQRLRNSVDAQPYSPWTYWLLANYLSAMGNHTEAVDAIEMARRLDPVSPYILTARGYVLTNSGQLDRAVEHWLSIGGRVSPQVVAGFLTQAYERKGDLDAAIQLAAERNHPAAELFAAAYQDAGARGYWRAIAAEVEKFYADRAEWFSFRYVVAMAKLGEIDKAMIALERGYELRNPTMVFIKTYPLENLHGDPRYENLLERMGLIED